MGILEKIQKEMRELRQEQAALRKMLSTRKSVEVEPEWMKVSDIAKKYGVSPDAVDMWLIMMAEEGHAVTIARVTTTSPRMVNVEQFDCAFMGLFANKAVA